MERIDCDVCVIGGGSGGIGAALGAARRGARTILVDRNHILGGTVTMSWVHNWEPTCGNAPVCRELWDRMHTYPNGALDMPFTTSSRNAEGKKNPTMGFELWVYQDVVARALSEAGCRVLLNVCFQSTIRDGRMVRGIVCAGPGAQFEIAARQFIDSTGDIAVCREAGCEHALGAEGRSDYGEPHAPETGDRTDLNAVNWIYRVRPTGSPVLLDDAPIPERAQRKGLFQAPMPNGDIVVNICGSGRYNPEKPEDYGRVCEEQRRLAIDSYRWFVRSGRFPDWQLLGLAPQLGIRESYRLKARYMLHENDARAGHHAQAKRDFMAFTDHPLDIHGAAIPYEDRILKQAYGIPFECLLAKEYDNLQAACRGIGATHIVSGSCRLSRTVMTMGYNAGAAAATACARNILLEDLEIDGLAEYEAP